jgi:hypothetical protein
VLWLNQAYGEVSFLIVFSKNNGSCLDGSWRMVANGSNSAKALMRRVLTKTHHLQDATGKQSNPREWTASLHLPIIINNL